MRAAWPDKGEADGRKPCRQTQRGRHFVTAGHSCKTAGYATAPTAAAAAATSTREERPPFWGCGT